MNNYLDMGEPTRVSRDGGYSKIESISNSNRKKIKNRIENPNILTGKNKLKEIYEKRGIIVNPDAMTTWYRFTK